MPQSAVHWRCLQKVGVKIAINTPTYGWCPRMDEGDSGEAFVSSPSPPPPPLCPAAPAVCLYDYLLRFISLTLCPVRTKSIPCVERALVRTGMAENFCRAHQGAWCAPYQFRAHGDVPRRHIVPRAVGMADWRIRCLLPAPSDHPVGRPAALKSQTAGPVRSSGSS